MDEYLKTVYTTYAGTEDGLEDLKVMAKNSPLPPADLEIKPAAVRRYEEEQKSRQENPLLWAFLDLKKTLQGPSGDSVWGDLRGKLTPRMRLYVVFRAGEVQDHQPQQHSGRAGGSRGRPFEHDEAGCGLRPSTHFRRRGVELDEGSPSS